MLPARQHLTLSGQGVTQVSGTLCNDDTTGPRRKHPLPSGPKAGAAARAVVRASCKEWRVPKSVRDVAIQCVAELGANIVHVDFSHAGGQLAWILAGLMDNHLIVEVWDPDPREPFSFDMAHDEGVDEEEDEDGISDSDSDSDDVLNAKSTSHPTPRDIDINLNIDHTTDPTTATAPAAVSSAGPSPIAAAQSRLTDIRARWDHLRDLHDTDPDMSGDLYTKSLQQLQDSLSEAKSDLITPIPESGRGLLITKALLHESKGFYMVHRHDGGKGLLFGLPLDDFGLVA